MGFPGCQAPLGSSVQLVLLQVEAVSSWGTKAPRLALHKLDVQGHVGSPGERREPDPGHPRAGLALLTLYG